MTTVVSGFSNIKFVLDLRSRVASGRPPGYANWRHLAVLKRWNVVKSVLGGQSTQDVRCAVELSFLDV